MTRVFRAVDSAVCDLTDNRNHGQSLPNCQPQCPNAQAASQSYIARIIRQASVTCVGNDSKRFVSREVLVESLDTQTVSSLLKGCFHQEVDPGLGHDTEAIASYISPKVGSLCHCSHRRCTGARIIFVVLSLISREDCIENFVRGKICDFALPLSLNGTHELVRRREALPDLPEGIQAWSLEEKRLFCHFQWSMLSPYFEDTPLRDIKTSELDKEVSLPWSESETPQGPPEPPAVEAEKARRPPPTIIKKIKINRHYHDFDDGDGHFALKSQRTQGIPWPRFKSELKGLVKTTKSHDNIVRLLAAFNHKGRCHLLSPWAEGGSLEEFWKTHSPKWNSDSTPEPPHSWCLPEWVWEQCRGLADGISFIHGYQAIASEGSGGSSSEAVPQLHGDIKPGNILCFETRDRRGRKSYILKISDFEFAKQFTRPGSSMSIKLERVTPSYHPPEVGIAGEEEEILVFQNWDVWCLGCVYLEFLSWFRYGRKDGIKKFRKARMNEEHDPRALNMIKSRAQEETFFRYIIERPRSPWRFGFWNKPVVGFETRQTVIEKYDLLSVDLNEPRMKRFIGFIKDKMIVTDMKTRATSEGVHMFFIRNE